MKKILSLTFLVLSLNASADITAGVKLVGKPLISQMKDQVCHLKLDGDEGTCSGVRLSTDYVLTAQHCARNTKGRKNSISLECNGNSLEVEKVYESQLYIDTTDNSVSSAFDFAVIKIKNPKPFKAKFKLLNNVAEYQNTLLNYSLNSTYEYAEPTYCEFHGYGEDRKKKVDNYNATTIDTSTVYNDETYLMKVQAVNTSAYVQSPFLPERNYKDENWLYSSVRPGDSGGPLFCKTMNGDTILSGVASVLYFGECPAKFQPPVKTGFFGKILGESKVQCHKSRWGIPTRDALEDLVGVRIVD